MSLADKAKLLLIPSGYKAGKVYSVFPTDGDGDFTFSRTGEATRINPGGLIETVATQVPRIDHYGGGCPSLLLEPQRTNLLIRSNDLTQLPFVGFTTNGSVAQNEIGIDGTISAWTWNKSSAFATTYLSIPTNNQNVFSFYIKKQNDIGIRILENVGNNTVFINLETGLTFYGNLASTTTVQDFNSEWWRISVTHTATNSRYYIYLNDGVNLTSTTGTVVLQNFQLEEGDYVTSYIATNGTASTRNADLCIDSMLNSPIITSDDWTLFFDLDSSDVRGINKRISLSDGTNANRVLLSYNANTQVYLFQTINANVIYNSAAIALSIRSKIAIVSNSNGFDLYANGSFRVSKTNGRFDASSINRISFLQGNNNLPFEGKVYDLRYYNEPLTSAEAIELTTL